MRIRDNRWLLALALTASLGFAACEDDEDGNNNNPGGPTTGTSPSPAAQPSPSPATSPSPSASPGTGGGAAQECNRTSFEGTFGARDGKNFTAVGGQMIRTSNGTKFVGSGGDTLGGRLGDFAAGDTILVEGCELGDTSIQANKVKRTNR